jgi:hypothetical protein
MGTFPRYALVLFWLYLPAFVVLSAASWPFPIPPPWPSDGILYVGHTLGTFEMLSLVWSVALLLTLLLYPRLPIAEPRCTPNGSPTIPRLPTPPPSPAALPTAINPLLLSEGSSPGATAASSLLLSRSPPDTPSPPTTHVDFGRVPVITPRAIVPPRLTQRITREHMSSLIAAIMPPNASLPSPVESPPPVDFSALFREDTPSASSSGPLSTSSSPSPLPRPSSAPLTRDLSDDLFTNRNGSPRTFEDVFPYDSDV